MFVLILDLIEDFHTVEDRRLHRIFCGLYFLANTQNFLLAVPVANAFALWYDKFSKLEID